MNDLRERPTWIADNGNGTFTNPLFYEEFSDPDVIRVGDAYYMTGTTMHTMPGLPVLRSYDLVNWELLTYAFDTLDLGPEYRLEGGEIYGQGIWAPCLRYKDGTFYIFTNVNKRKTQLFTATDPAGPWTRTDTEYALHDLSVLFDDDGRNWVIWGYRNMQIAELDASLTRIVPGSARELFLPDSDMGEGVHFYKIDGKYMLTSAWFSGRMRMPGARADRLEGPWEFNPALSFDEDFGLMEGNRLKGGHLPFTATPPFEFIPPNPADRGRMALHQGGIVDTPDGDWWGWSMMDYNSIGRLTCLSPVTWKDGWPYFGLDGNLGRTPRTWVKPKATRQTQPAPLFERCDDFDGPELKPIWQWNHVPVAGKWSLTARHGHLRLNSLPAESFWEARNTLTQRSVGPISTVTAKLDGSGLVDGDVAGLGLLGVPYYWLGLSRVEDGWQLGFFDQNRGVAANIRMPSSLVWLRAEADFLTEEAQFSYSLDGTHFMKIGGLVPLVFQLKTFQGYRAALFNYNAQGSEGGAADFDSFDVDEPFPRGLMRPIPYDETGRLLRFGAEEQALTVAAHELFTVADLGLGRVALVAGGQHVAVAADGTVHMVAGVPGADAGWQWMETPTGEVMLMSLVTNRFLRATTSGAISADRPGPVPDGSDGVRFIWQRS